jgi:glutaredoxin
MMTGTVTVYGAPWCGDCRRTKRFLDQHQISYTWFDTDDDEQAAVRAQQLQNGGMLIPVVVMPDGRVMVEPADQELARALNVRWPI